MTIMKNIKPLILVLTIFGLCIMCEEEEHSERFKLLTGPVWMSDSLMANGMDAGGPGGLLEKFNGEAKFNEDGTGNFGEYVGNWYFSNNEKDITIMSDSLILALTCRIVELTELSFKITTSFPIPDLPEPVDIRITFKPK